ncbi:MAG: SbcC/MukB-like Walker B domain-containing protein [Gordonibacter sp.]
MKTLNKMHLVNWFYYDKEFVDFGLITYLTGENSSGKSTLIDALQVILLGELRPATFNKAASETSKRTLSGYLRTDLDGTDKRSRVGKNFDTYIAGEFHDSTLQTSFVAGVTYACEASGDENGAFFFYEGTIPPEGYVRDTHAMTRKEFQSFLASSDYSNNGQLFPTATAYREFMLARWNVHSAQLFSMLKKAISFKPIDDIEQFITENICDLPEKLDIEAMQQNIQNYQQQLNLARQLERQRESLLKIQNAYLDSKSALERERTQMYLVDRAAMGVWEEKKIKFQALRNAACQERDSLDERLSRIGEETAVRRQKMDELVVRKNSDSGYQRREKLASERDHLAKEMISADDFLDKRELRLRQEAQRLGAFCLRLDDEDNSSFIDNVAKTHAQALLDKLDLQEDFTFTAPGQNSSFFEKLVKSTTSLFASVEDIHYQLKRTREELARSIEEDRTARGQLEKGLKDYPADLLTLKAYLQEGLPLSVRGVRVLADVVEVADEHWRNTLEGYLGMQKFYLLVDESDYQEAQHLFHQYKKEHGVKQYGLVDIDKLRANEQREQTADSLAKQVETNDPVARDYLDYLLGRVTCCEEVARLRQHRIAVTAEGMLYQGYVLRALSQFQCTNHYLGKNAIEQRKLFIQNRIDEHMGQLGKSQNFWNLLEAISRSEKTFTPNFLQHELPEIQQQAARRESLTLHIANIDAELGTLDLTFMQEIEQQIKEENAALAALAEEGRTKAEQRGSVEERRKSCDSEIPHCDSEYELAQNTLREHFDDKYQADVGEPRYADEHERHGSAEKVGEVYHSSLAHTKAKIERQHAKLIDLRQSFTDDFPQLAFNARSLDNKEYDAYLDKIQECDLPLYQDKILKARESAAEQFKNDFLAKLKTNIEQVQLAVKNLNRALSSAQFGNDHYRFIIQKSLTYADFYDMIMDPSLMEDTGGLFADAFQGRYSDLIERLFHYIVGSEDDKQNIRRRDELERNVALYTDFRTYLKFDLCITDETGAEQMLSRTIRKKSGGETQTPFYIAVLASFVQLYRATDTSVAGNTLRLVVFDEAFSKMDGGRIAESIRLARDMQLQIVICTPPDKAPYIMPQADRTLIVHKNLRKRRMSIIPAAKGQSHE